MMTIEHKLSGHPAVFLSQSATIKQAVMEAVSQGADLEVQRDATLCIAQARGGAK